MKFFFPSLDAADDIATAAEVVDLLVCFATVAVRSPRNNLIFEPFPTVFDPNNPKQAVLSPQNKDFALCTQILSKFPSVEQMSKAKDFSDMKKKMDNAHKYAYSLLQWFFFLIFFFKRLSHNKQNKKDYYIKSFSHC